MKKLVLTTIVLSVLFLSGCGTDTVSKNSSIRDKKYIMIHIGMEEGECKNEYKDYLDAAGFDHYILEETDRTTNCETYGRKNDHHACTIIDSNDGNKNCVVGLDSINGVG